MLQKNLKTASGKLTVQIPSSLSEITIGQIMELQEEASLSDIKAISILSGIPVQQLQNVKNAADFSVFGEAVLSLSHEIKHLYNSSHIPKVITFPGGKTVKVINNLSVEPAGAFMAARDIISDEIAEHIKVNGEADWQQHFNPSLKACCKVLAHYFYCRVTGKAYNEYEAEEFITEIKKLRVMEALPVARHFFTCYPSLRTPKTSFWHRLLQRLNDGRVYTNLRSSGISTP
ncbi:hypothetical protein [Mucilaginibacter sp. L3T2-6]|uniref:hypothetical protein n=1 Tax=Mucilaginibacter sp. L3T2-6 TaxID=3062491 RepID=UPI002674C8B9|nr:hypothetical protein [Mucilaginibacter sp. L3T2-6]MDO3644717.1 hypothetical protein [Mucilaginibacter sp. L3T2-6]MDV6217169.1 hypothetical protein [Mucilaginibacter sp. L3T2-6]